MAKDYGANLFVPIAAKWLGLVVDGDDDDDDEDEDEDDDNDDYDDDGWLTSGIGDENVDDTKISL